MSTKIPKKLRPFILELGFTQAQFATLKSEVREMLLEKARSMYEESRCRSPGEEFKESVYIINPNIGTKLLRHVFTRRRHADVSATQFVGEVLESLKALAHRHPDRTFNNYVFYFVTEDNRLYPISIATADIKNMGVEKCLEELVKLDQGRQHALYQNGSGEEVLQFLGNRRLYTNMFNVSSRSQEQEPEVEAESEPGTVPAPPKHPKAEFSGRPQKLFASATKVKYIGFDFETVIDPKTSTVVPYAVSLIVYEDQVETRRTLVISHKPRKVKEAVAKVIRDERSNNPDHLVYMIGFNNANFDNFLLYEIIQEYGISHSEPFISNGCLLAMSVESIIVKDLRRFVMESLAKACEGFGTSVGKGSLAHHEVQLEHYDGNLKKYLKKNYQKIKEYTEQDVVSMMELWFKCKVAYYKITNIHIEDHATLAKVTYTAFTKTVSEDIWDQRPRIDEDHESFIRASTYGGRSQVFAPMTHVEQKLAQGDVKSLYPHLMKEGLYPLGTAKHTRKYMPNKVGVYRAKIIKQPRICIVPLRREGGLDWDHHEPFEAHVTNVSLELLDRYGGQYVVYEGYFWSKSVHVFDDYISKLYKLKQKQDRYRDTNNPKYNPSLRNIVKLLMNALSGKMVQRTYTDTVRLIETSKQLLDFESKTKEDTREYIPHGNVVYAKGKISDEHIQRNIPIIWGIMIYEYSRAYMYDKVYSKMPVLATETDSYTATVRDARKHMKEYPELYGDEMGQLEVEYLKETVYGIFVAKKCMCLYTPAKPAVGRKPAVERKIRKATFKGVNIRADKVITQGEYDLLSTDEYKYRYYWDKDCGDLIGVDTYEKMVEGSPVLILCSQLVHRLRPEEDRPMAHVKQIFRLKHFHHK